MFRNFIYFEAEEIHENAKIILSIHQSRTSGGEPVVSYMNNYFSYLCCMRNVGSKNSNKNYNMKIIQMPEEVQFSIL